MITMLQPSTSFLLNCTLTRRLLITNVPFLNTTTRHLFGFHMLVLVQPLCKYVLMT